MKAVQAFDSRNRDETIRYQDQLMQRGAIGQVAYGLFRAQKRSTRAKGYRRGHRRNSYEAKQEALAYLDAALRAYDMTRHEADLPIKWGWKRDPSTKAFEWVLYVQPTGVGQCSFHSSKPVSDQRFHGQWRSRYVSKDIVLNFCDGVMELSTIPLSDDHLMPFGQHNAKALGSIDSGYFQFIGNWDVLPLWGSLYEYTQNRLIASGLSAG